MKLFWLAFLGLVTMATGQRDVARQFLVLDDGPDDPNDINPDEMGRLEEGEEVQDAARRLLRQTLPGLNDTCDDDLPPAYQEAAKARTAMFDTSSASNLALAPSRVGRQTSTNLYYCPHNNYVLRWFPYYSGWLFTEICFVPWATSQNIIYAKCADPTCELNNQGTGRCRPTCYTRRRLLVLCYNWQTRSWRWRWVVRNLPRACGCSTC